MNKLYELSDSFEQLFNQVDELDMEDENLADFEEAIATSLEGIQSEFEDTAEGLAVFIKRLDGSEDILADEIKKLQARKKTIGNKSNWFKNYLLFHMQKIGVLKIDKPKAVLSIRNNAESVAITDLNALLNNANYIKPRKLDEDVIDKTKVKKDIQSGFCVQGAELIRKQSLTIK